MAYPQWRGQRVNNSPLIGHRDHRENYLITRRNLSDSGRGQCSYVRLFVPSTLSSDPDASPVEYEGVLLDMAGLPHFVLHCTSDRTKDLIFMILASGGLDLDGRIGRYLSVYIAGDNLPGTRSMKLTRVNTEGKPALSINDATIEGLKARVVTRRRIR
jgi:hypothetical protein